MVTYELKVVFADGRDGTAQKRAALAALERRGITSFAEGVIDGVAEALPEEGEAAAAALELAPLLIFGEDRQELAALGADLGRQLGVSTALAEVPDEAWREAWAADFDALVTERFAVHRDGWPGAVPPGRERIVLGPGEAFGSGRHATTQVALEVLAALPPGHDRDGGLDVGTGNGVLAMAAARLGFTGLVGTEIDADALAEARRNAALNSVDLTLHLTADLPGDRRYALIIANILVPVLHQLMPRFAALLAPGGTLVLAGFVAKEEGPLLAAAERHGLGVCSRHECRGWVGLALTADESCHRHGGDTKSPRR